MECNLEKTKLDSEYNRLAPKASRTMRDRQRMSEIERRLADIDRETTTLRSQIRKAAPTLEV